MSVKVLFLIALLCASNLLSVNGGRGRSGSSRSRTSSSRSHSSSHSSHSNNPGWFSWFRGNKNVATASKPVSQKSTSPTFNHRSNGHPVAASHVGFSAYGNNYQSNFHHSSRPYHFQPVSHPYQSHFQPRTTDVFAYHFMPILPHTHVHHIHHYSTNDPVYYDYRNASTESKSLAKEPIVYDFKPPIQNTSFASSEEYGLAEPINPNDYFIAGVENMLFYGMMKENQHQVIFTMQGSDGISYESELLSMYGEFDKMTYENDAHLQYFPDVEFRFDADDEPNDDDLGNINEMYRKLIEYGGC